MSDPVEVEIDVDEAVRQGARLWWLVLVVGIVFVGFGIMTLFDVARGASVVALIIGLFMIFDGVVEMVSGGRGGVSRGWAIVIGLLLFVGGIVVIAYPEYTFELIAIIWGITMIVGGIGRFVASLMLRDYGWGWRLTFGVVEAIIGVLVIAWPDVTAYVLLLLIGAYAIIAGIVQIVLAFQLKAAPERLEELRRRGGPGGPVYPAF
jgi:uncharacterized membrane protein HdeD (DUF308 family)